MSYSSAHTLHFSHACPRPLRSLLCTQISSTPLQLTIALAASYASFGPDVSINEARRLTGLRTAGGTSGSSCSGSGGSRGRWWWCGRRSCAPSPSGVGRRARPGTSSRRTHTLPESSRSVPRERQTRLCVGMVHLQPVSSCVALRRRSKRLEQTAQVCVGVRSGTGRSCCDATLTCEGRFGGVPQVFRALIFYSSSLPLPGYSFSGTQERPVQP